LRRLGRSENELIDGKYTIEDDIIIEKGKVGARGGLSSVELGFSDIRMELKTKKRNGGKKILLDGSIRGRARPGRMLAIMGPR